MFALAQSGLQVFDWDQGSFTEIKKPMQLMHGLILWWVVTDLNRGPKDYEFPVQILTYC